MCGLAGTVNIKFLLEQRIDGTIEIEREARRTRRAQLVVYIEASGAFLKKTDLGARQAPIFSAIVPTGISVGLIESAHSGSIPHELRDGMNMVG